MSQLIWFGVWNVFVANLSINKSTSKYIQFSSNLNLSDKHTQLLLQCSTSLINNKMYLEYYLIPNWTGIYKLHRLFNEQTKLFEQ